MEQINNTLSRCVDEYHAFNARAQRRGELRSLFIFQLSGAMIALGAMVATAMFGTTLLIHTPAIFFGMVFICFVCAVGLLFMAARTANKLGVE